MAHPTLEFLRNEAGEEEGLGDAGIETFRDAPYASCAREAGQNSKDAEEGRPVRLTFDVFSVTHGDLPSYERLRSAIDQCAAGAEQEKEIEFFENAGALADQSEIRVLRIADFNTKGLMGPPDQSGTPFRSLLKGSGVSKKDSETSGGSFGIGKNASFAVSDLQTVFYSTVYLHPETQDKAFAAQGKVKLVSHTDAGGVQRRATGYWGYADGFRAVQDVAAVPPWLRRDEVGTSIFCVGFRETQDWAERMTYSLVSNFFCAVHRDEMVFEVSSKIHVNRNTLEGLLNSPEVIAAAENSGHKADLEFAAQLYRCLVSDMAQDQVVSVPGLGAMRVRILVQEGMPKRVAFVRNGMLITDNLRHFGQALARFPGTKDFVALVEPVDVDAQRLLKKLENPAHNGFSAERISDPAKRAAAEAAMKKLGKLLRDLIRDTTGVTQSGAVVLEELGKFFAEQGRSHASDPNAENDPETFRYEPLKRSKPRASAAKATGESGGQGGSQTRSGGGGSNRKGGGGAGDSGSQSNASVISIREVRNRICRDGKGSPVSRELHFTPDSPGKIIVSVQATGVNGPERLRIRQSSRGTVQSGSVVLDVAGRNRESVTLTLDEAYDGPIEVLAITPNERRAGE